ncbi:MAG: peptidase T [Eubacteriaceae bacterium]|nr:peptidase T [Eubacteriaceae bacterium]
MRDKLLERFIRYAKIETRSYENTGETPSTATQSDFADILAKELRGLGINNTHVNKGNGFVIASLPANTQGLDAIGFIAHVDTADFEAVGVKPQVVENYDGVSDIQLANSPFFLKPAEFPSLLAHKGETLITTSGDTLLGADDKAGIAEIFALLEYFLENPDVPHGDIYVGFGPDEEIGSGADKFDIKDFPVAFAYTVDGGAIGKLAYESFNAAKATVVFSGMSVHPGSAKDVMVNALALAIEFDNHLPAKERPEHTDGYEGYFHLTSLAGSVENAVSSYILRDHDKGRFEARKEKLKEIAWSINGRGNQERVAVELEDQYYNMGDVLKNDMRSVELAIKAMELQGIKPVVEPIRGGTDGSKITFMGIPTPNVFAGYENAHGRFEYVSLDDMAKAANTLIAIVKLSAQGQ